MTACTERRRAAPPDGLPGEGRKGMTKEGTLMTACTERRRAAPPDGRSGEGRKGMTKEGRAT